MQKTGLSLNTSQTKPEANDHRTYVSMWKESMHRFRRTFCQRIIWWCICFSISFHWYAFWNFWMQISRPLAYGVCISSKASATTDRPSRVSTETMKLIDYAFGRESDCGHSSYHNQLIAPCSQVKNKARYDNVCVSHQWIQLLMRLETKPDHSFHGSTNMKILPCSLRNLHFSSNCLKPFWTMPTVKQAMEICNFWVIGHATNEICLPDRTSTSSRLSGAVFVKPCVFIEQARQHGHIFHTV